LFHLDVSGIGELSMPELNRILNEGGATSDRERQLVRLVIVLRSQYQLANAALDAITQLNELSNRQNAMHVHEIQRLDGELAKLKGVLNDLRKTFEAGR
jgi:hypothetical protein